MNVENPITSDRQLVRLLQIGIVLEEVVEVRAGRHVRSLPDHERDDLDPAVRELLNQARAESAEHRARLEVLIDRIDAEAVPLEQIERLVEARYTRTGPDDFADVLYDQLHAEESAYKFYDDLVGAIEESRGEFGVDREELVSTLVGLREDEAEGVEEVATLMEEV